MPSKDSIRILEEDRSSTSVDRGKCQLIQTPQTFKGDLIKKAYDAVTTGQFTDDASVLERAQVHARINLVEGDYRNIKITSPEDLLIAEALLREVRIN